ncbi:MAG: helix-turn-helix transcriptional regulator [Pseudomonadota bacterium]
MTGSIHTDLYRGLIRKLVEARNAAGLTQQTLADRLGKPQSYVAKVEGYERRVDVVEFLELAREIGVDPLPMLDEALKKL